MLQKTSSRLSWYSMITAIMFSAAISAGSLFSWLPPFVSSIRHGSISGIAGGNDFAMYHAASELGAAGRWTDAYSLEGLAAALGLRVGTASFAYPPMLAQAIEPLTLITYQSAVAVWLGVSLIAYAALLFLNGRVGLVALAAFSFPAYVAIRFGQFVPIGLGALVLATIALRRHRLFLAGMAFGTLVLKPQLMIGPLLIAILDDDARSLLRGMLASSGSMVLVSFVAEPSAWWAFVRGLRETAQPGVTSSWDYSLLSLFQPLPPWATALCYGVAVVSLSALAVISARQVEGLEQKLAIGIVLAVAVSPRMVVYDWTILVVAAIWLAPVIVAEQWVRWAAAFVIVGGLSGHPAGPANIGWLTLAAFVVVLFLRTKTDRSVARSLRMLELTDRSSKDF